jgi:hypothetical protein
LDDLRAVWQFLLTAPWHDLTQEQIGQQVLGYSGLYAGPACLRTLQRFGLVKKMPHPKDKRRRFYAGKGDFDAVDWKFYLDERQQTFDRFEQFCGLVQMPEAHIPDAIDSYFEGAADELEAAPF